MTYISKEIDTYIQSEWRALPALTKQVIKEGTYREVVQHALNKAGVGEHGDTLNTLNLNVLLVLLNLQTKEEFENSIATHLSDKERTTVVTELDAQIFSSIT